MIRNLNFNPRSVQLDEIVDPDHYRDMMVEGFLSASDDPGATAIDDGEES
jgi:hypothetical protein